MANATIASTTAGRIQHAGALLTHRAARLHVNNMAALAPERTPSRASSRTSGDELAGQRTQTPPAIGPEMERQEEIPAGEMIPEYLEEKATSQADELSVQMSDEEIYYDPPSDSAEIPSLHRLVDDLETGESDLESDGMPPSLFTRPEHVPAYQKISQLKLQLQDSAPRSYEDAFERAVQDNMLMIGNISLEDVQEEEKRLRDAHIRYEQQQADVAREREVAIKTQEEKAKKRVADELRERRKYLERMAEVARQKERLQMQWLHKAFKKAENSLTTALRRRRAEVKTMYGDLTVTDGEYGGTKGRRWKVDWNRTPQPIQVKLKSLRGVKDKLPGGRYILIASLYSRLGGSIMRWSKLRGQTWGGATLPVIHNGNFFNTEVKLDQSLFTVLPSKPDVRPGMILVFELFLLRGAVLPMDRCVGWGCFPICDGEFNVIEGKYKVPFLRGEVDHRIDKFEKIEKLISSDLDHWLCNLYFEIVRLPRYLAGQTEFEVELQNSSGQLNYPDRVDTQGDEYRDGIVPIKPAVSDSQPTLEGDFSANNLRQLQSASMRPISEAGPSNRNPLPSVTSSSLGSLDAKTPYSSRERRAAESPKIKQRPMTTYGSRFAKKEKKVKVHDTDSSSGDEEEVVEDCAQKEDEFLPVPGETGLFYKRHDRNPFDIYGSKMCTLLPKTDVLMPKVEKKKLTPAQELLQHTVSVKQAFSDKGHLPNPTSKRMSYVGRQFLSEIGLSRCFSAEFWMMAIVFIFTFFLRIFTHYIGQWLVLTSIKININKFEFLPYTVTLAYQNSLLSTSEEMIMVIVGPLLIFGCFVLAVIVSWLSQLVLGTFPDIGSKFILNYGMQSFFDPIFILIVDACLGTYMTDLVEKKGGDNAIADSAKLYWYFLRTEGSGVGGIALTAIVYAFVFFASIAVLYMYFLRLHNNGRMLDVYWRLHSAEEEMLVPYDLEMSHHELMYIVKKAEQWRGEEGERRKVAVYDFVMEEVDDEDENSPGEEARAGGKAAGKKGVTKEVTTHIAVHTIHLDGLRELYRQFLRLPDGAIIEVFGDLSSVPGLDKSVTKLLAQGDKPTEDGVPSATDNEAGTSRRDSLSRIVRLRRGPSDSPAAARDPETSSC